MKLSLNKLAPLLLVAVGCGGSATQTGNTTAAAPADQSSATDDSSQVVVAGFESRSADDHSDKADRSHNKGKTSAYPPGSAMYDGGKLLEQGKFTDAAQLFAGVTTKEPDNAHAWLMYGYSLHAAGQLDEALPIHHKAATFDKTAPVALYNIACVHALRGELDQAFEALGASVDKGFDKPEYLHKDEDLANLRSDARFSAMMEAAERNADDHAKSSDSDKQAETI